MKIIDIKGTNNVYSSNVYMILGEWKKMTDLSTLIDVGSDPSIINVINKIYTGVGKKKVDQVILTHNHSDHMSILPLIIQEYHPVVYAYSPFLAGVTKVLQDRETLLIGDEYFEVIHTPGHSSDSISLYNASHKILFVGDTSVIVRAMDSGAYEEDYVDALKRLCRKDVKTIYFGHGDPVLDHGQSLLMESLKNIQKSISKEAKSVQRH
jgi:glyoxylase-like metal-dependent hydrolase (beta-lactamase superfamily II)